MYLPWDIYFTFVLEELYTPRVPARTVELGAWSVEIVATSDMCSSISQFGGFLDGHRITWDLGL